LSSPLSIASNCSPIVRSAYGLFATAKCPSVVIFATNNGDVFVVSFEPDTVPAAVFRKFWNRYEIPFPVDAKLESSFTSPVTFEALNIGTPVVTST